MKKLLLITMGLCLSLNAMADINLVKPRQICFNFDVHGTLPKDRTLNAEIYIAANTVYDNTMYRDHISQQTITCIPIDFTKANPRTSLYGFDYNLTASVADKKGYNDAQYSTAKCDELHYSGNHIDHGLPDFGTKNYLLTYVPDSEQGGTLTCSVIP